MSDVRRGKNPFCVFVIQNDSILVKPDNYNIINAKDRSELKGLNNELAAVCWPVFMRHDPVAKYFIELYEEYPEFQFGLEEKVTGEVIAIGNCILLHWSDSPENLPDDGWDWVIEKGVKDRLSGIEPNILSAIQVMIIPEYRAKGLSHFIVQTMKSIGKAYGLNTMIAPVRPSMKSRHPRMPMEEFIHLKNDKGLPYDAWMRVHASLGAQIVKVCPRSMRVAGTVEVWEDWTELRFPEDGEYEVPGALVPIIIEIGLDLGLYTEPNVWMVHQDL